MAVGLAVQHRLHQYRTQPGIQGLLAGPAAGIQAGPVAGTQAGLAVGIQAGPVAGIPAGPEEGNLAGPEEGNQDRGFDFLAVCWSPHMPVAALKAWHSSCEISFRWHFQLMEIFTSS